MMVFTILTEAVPSYAVKMKKVEAASGVSMAMMIYVVSPTALVLSGIVKVLFHATSETWKAERSGPGNSSSRSRKGKSS